MNIANFVPERINESVNFDAASTVLKLQIHTHLTCCIFKEIQFIAKNIQAKTMRCFGNFKTILMVCKGIMNIGYKLF